MSKQNEKVATYEEMLAYGRRVAEETILQAQRRIDAGVKYLIIDVNSIIKNELTSARILDCATEQGFNK